MYKLLLPFLIGILFSFPAVSQQKFTAIPVNSRTQQSLDSHFNEYSIFSINTSAIRSFARNQSTDIRFQLDLPGLVNLDIDLTEDDILAPGYTLTVANPTGNQVFEKPQTITYKGFVNGDASNRIRLTLTDEIIYGILKSGSQEYFIEPLHYIKPGAPADLFVVYETKDAKKDPTLTCGVTEKSKEQKRISEANRTEAGTNCVTTELAIASDQSMYARYGSASAVQVHNIGVINNVLWDYVNAQLNNNIQIIIVGQNVSTSSATDQISPAHTGTNSSTILSGFRTWGENGNFGFTYDLAELWTTRDIDSDGAGTNSGIIGLAYVGVVCTNARYHLLEDFAGSNPSGSGYLLHVTATHEIGHNFNASHDASGSPFIMAPSVQNTSTWSAASITSIDNHVSTRSCLAQCSAAGLPVADFLANPSAICTGSSVQFTDRTIGGPTSWTWTFEGGTPATSNDRNPVVSFATAGIKLVTLTVNNGTGTNAKFSYIGVNSIPAAACIPTGTGTSNAGIKSFSLNTINKITGGLAEDGNKYLNFSCSDNTALNANTTYNVSVNVGTTNPSNEFNLIQLFIDYNNDGDFLDANEAVYSSPSCYIGTHTFSFTTPAVIPVTNQLLRVRVIAKDCIGGVNSCYVPTLGQVEDYGVIFYSIVPVSMMSFSGKYIHATSVLNWETSSEINHSHFEIERSFTGTNYTKIGTVNGANRPNGSSYSFTDILADKGNNQRFFYRLKIADLNGGFTYSDVVVLKDESSKSLFSIYPNPVKRGASIQLETLPSNVSKIEIINSQGQVVYSRNYVARGTAGLSIPIAEAWPSGQYLLRTTGESNNQVEKFIVY